jgi:uncharacterized protein
MVRWQGRRRSGNVIDVRGGGPGGRAGRGAAIGCGPLLIALIAALLFGVNPLEVLALLDGGAPPTAEAPAPGEDTVPQDEAGEFVAVILGDTEDTWHALFREAGGQYREPELVLFSNSVRSECGMSGSATGPFYCPLDQRVFLDLAFIHQLERLGATGELAIAYVIAHEVGHHVQHQQGILQQTRARQQRLSRADANALQVRVELQADCYAGIWAHHAERQHGFLRPEDLQDAMDAAAAVGSDHLARQAGRPVQPETFTHGTSAQRVEWFQRGLQSGDPAECDPFGAL